MSLRVSSCCALTALLLIGCGGGASVEPGVPPTYGFVPDLRGTSVLVFPVQLVSGDARRDVLDRELSFAVGEKGAEWLMPDDLEKALARSPGVDVELRNLPVSSFLQREVERVGDPMFGYFIRLSALTGGRVALVPVSIQSTEADLYGDVSWSISAALIDSAEGWVIWYGTVEGERGPPGSAQLGATAAAALVERLRPSRR
ncbi:MAG: hypothetical protein ACR2QM_06515 [Longimicrobiales bacterium]